MRVLFFGNKGNTGFRICKWLREKGYDALLLMESGSQMKALPEWEDERYKGGYPDWIRFFHPPRFFFPFDSRKKLLKNFFSILRRPLKGESYYPQLPEHIKLLGEGRDVVLTTGPNWINAFDFNKPVIFIPIGEDLYGLPFRSGYVGESFTSYVARRRAKNFSAILGAQLEFYWATKILGISHKLLPFILPVDSHQMRENIDPDFYQEMNRKYSGFDRVFIHITRKNLNPERMDYKGNEWIVSPLRKIIENHPEKSFRVIIGRAGRDFQKFYDLLEQEGLLPYCDFVDRLPLPKLYALLSLPNGIVLDAFKKPLQVSFGGISRESLALGRPLITARDAASATFIQVFGKECPIFNAYEEGDIEGHLEALVRMDGASFEELTGHIRSWAYEKLDQRNRMDDLVSVIKRNLFEELQ